MTYSELSKEITQLSYRDKFRLAQLLIQRARKEEEEQNPQSRQKNGSATKLDPSSVQFVAERLQKLKPSKKETLLNSIAAMFQFQGGISDSDKEKMFAELQKRGYIVLDGKGACNIRNRRSGDQYSSTVHLMRRSVRRTTQPQPSGRL